MSLILVAFRRFRRYRPPTPIVRPDPRSVNAPLRNPRPERGRGQVGFRRARDRRQLAGRARARVPPGRDERPGGQPDRRAVQPGGLVRGFLGQSNARFGASRNSDDIVLAPAAFSGAAIGLLDADTVRDFAAPTAGYTRLVDLLAADQQLPSDDQLMAWKGGNAPINALPGFPQVTSDIGFFVAPAIADLDGDGKREVIAGNGVAVLGAHESDGARPAGWPKLQVGWLLGTPGLGDLDGNGLAEIAVVRRDGQLFVWRTQQPAASLDQWPRFGGNPRNSGRPVS